MSKEKHRNRTLYMALALFFLWGWPASAAELERFEDVRLLEAKSNDGDSFQVQLGDESFHLRLYFVDCPETSASMDSDVRRLREQTRYWALSGPKQTVQFGDEAKKFGQKLLEKPFTVHTAFASAPGRSKKGRIYGFVTTAEGEDLATLLVKNGLARVQGVGRKTPDGVRRDEMKKRLRDLELAAVLKRAGIWDEADADLITGLRQKEREEHADLDTLRQMLYPASTPEEPLDPNTASQENLQAIPGIGAVLSERIVDGRPYETWEDLEKVEDIGRIRLRKIKEFGLDPEKWEVEREDTDKTDNDE